MALNMQPYKGARDFYPEDLRIRDYIFNVAEAEVRKFGYEKYDAPLIEPLDLYRAKTGDEIVNEQTYTFTDRGGREVAIRPEMTPTVSRMVAARRQELAYPVRWYSIPNLWRYERPQRGRLREHWQLNVDIFGDEAISANHEVILLGANILKALGAKPSMYQIKLNDRRFIDYIMTDYLGLNEVQAHSLVKLIDRMHKIDPAVFVADVDAICSPSQKAEGLADKIVSLLNVKSIDDLPEDLKNNQALAELKKLIGLLAKSGTDNCLFDITLMRGFDYYNGVVFEFFDNDPENNRAMFGGGRYDGLVGLFGVESVATVGFGVGDVTLTNFLESHDLLPELKTATDVLVVTIGDTYEGAQELIAALREMELNVAVDATDRKLPLKLKHADKSGVRYVIFVGETELKEGRFPLKDLVSGAEEVHSPERLVSIIKDFRR